MAITASQPRKVREVHLEQARDHFLPCVQFKEVNAYVIIDKCGDEWIRIDLTYTAPEPVRDAELMNSLYRRTDEPLLGADVTELTRVHYINTNDPS